VLASLEACVSPGAVLPTHDFSGAIQVPGMTRRTFSATAHLARHIKLARLYIRKDRDESESLAPGD
jgi:hypothetical protein